MVGVFHLSQSLPSQTIVFSPGRVLKKNLNHAVIRSLERMSCHWFLKYKSFLFCLVQKSKYESVPSYRKNKYFTQSKLYKTKILFNSLQIRVFDYLQCKTTLTSLKDFITRQNLMQSQPRKKSVIHLLFPKTKFQWLIFIIVTNFYSPYICSHTY